MDELRALAQQQKLKPSTKNIGMKKIFFLVVSFLGNQSFWKTQSIRRWWSWRADDWRLRGTSCFVIKFGKLVNNWLPNFGKEGKMVYASSITHLEKRQVIKVEGIGEHRRRSSGPCYQRQMTDLYQPDKTIETRAMSRCDGVYGR